MIHKANSMHTINIISFFLSVHFVYLTTIIDQLNFKDREGNIKFTIILVKEGDFGIKAPG